MRTTNRFTQQQQGAALIVGLMLLLILTVLAVSGITTTTLEATMAGNTQQSEYAFQAAESAADSEIVGGVPINYVGDEITGDIVRGPTTYNYPGDANPIVTADVTTVYRQDSLASESQVQVHFEVRADANTTERGARSVQRGGFYVLAPVPNN